MLVRGEKEQELIFSPVFLQINEVRRLVGTFPEKLSTFSSDASISRYLRAQNWNVKKATKLLKETLKWRLEYKPEAIKWVTSSLTFPIFIVLSSKPIYCMGNFCYA